MRVDKSIEHKPIATHVLTVMVRGINFHLQYPVAYYGTNGFNGYQLYPIFWEIVRSLEYMGLSVWFVACDGAAPNRRFFKIHELNKSENTDLEGIVYWTKNPFSLDPNRKLWFICDVPHLIKTVRNNFSNSHGHSNTRDLFVCLFAADFL